MFFIYLFFGGGGFINTLQVLVGFELQKYVYNITLFLKKKKKVTFALSTLASHQDSCELNPGARGLRVMSLHVLFRFVI